MNRNLRTLVFGLGMATLGAVGATTVSALAEPGFERPPHGEHGPHMRGPRMPGQRFAMAVARLDLTEDQQALLDELKDDTRAEMEALRESHEGEMDGLKEQLLGDGAVDRAALHAMLDQHAADRLAAAHGFLDKVLDIQATLTPEQKAELKAMSDKMEARREERREAFEGREDGPGKRGRR